jgi:hypothetical protein
MENLIELPNGGVWKVGKKLHQQDIAAQQFVSDLNPLESVEDNHEDVKDGTGNVRILSQKWVFNSFHIVRIYDYCEKELPHPAWGGLNDIFYEVKVEEVENGA